MNSDHPSLPVATSIDRRTALKWVLTATAAMTLRDRVALAAGVATDARGYGTDPDLTRTYAPGELWPLTLTTEQRKTVTALCDLIIPADERSPAASAVGVPDFIDEWISAPYPQQRTDRAQLLAGLAWLDRESHTRTQRAFHELSLEEQTTLIIPASNRSNVAPENATAATFFDRFRDLTAGGFYTSPIGMKDIGYVGNLPLAEFAGPPPAVLKQAGLG